MEEALLLLFARPAHAAALEGEEGHDLADDGSSGLDSKTYPKTPYDAQQESDDLLAEERREGQHHHHCDGYQPASRKLFNLLRPRLQPDDNFRVVDRKESH
jgi:hypothetical protein